MSRSNYATNAPVQPKYAVVIHPGEWNEREIASYSTYAAASAYLDAIPAGGSAYDIMRRLPDGSLTTEY